MSGAPMFTDADELHLFTRSELQARLGDTCTVDWFLRRFRIPTECKGRVIAGADVVRAMRNKPAAEAEETPAETAATVQPVPVPSVPRKFGRSQKNGTCARLERLTPEKNRA